MGASQGFPDIYKAVPGCASSRSTGPGVEFTAGDESKNHKGNLCQVCVKGLHRPKQVETL